MRENISDDTVYVYKSDTPGATSRSAYEFLKAIAPLLKKRVVIKPNITVPAKRDSGIVTHPDFVAGLADYFREMSMSGEDILVAEGGGTGNMDSHFSMSGYTEMAQRQGIRLVNLNFDEVVPVHLPQAEMLKDIGIAKTVKDQDNYFINVPKLKTHNLAVTTLSMKNLMGTIVPPHTKHLCSVPREYAGRQNEITPNGIELREELLCQRICDLSLASKPDLNIVEGIVGRDGTAFHHGKNIQTDLVVGGKNIVSVDAVASYLMGFDPAGIGYLKIAAGRGLGTIDIGEIKIYEICDGQIIPCRDISRFMSHIPFEVLAWEKRAINIPLNRDMLARLQSVNVQCNL